MRSECRAQPSPPPLSCTARTLSHVGKTKLNVPDIIAHTLLTMAFCHPFDVVDVLSHVWNIQTFFLLKFYVKDERKFAKKLAFFFIYYILFVYIYAFFFFFRNLHWHESVDWTKSETQVAHSHLCSNLIFVDFSIWNYKIIEIEKTKKIVYFQSRNTGGMQSGASFPLVKQFDHS